MIRKKVKCNGIKLLIYAFNVGYFFTDFFLALDPLIGQAPKKKDSYIIIIIIVFINLFPEAITVLLRAQVGLLYFGLRKSD